MRLSRLSSIAGVVLVLLAGSANLARAQQAQGNLQIRSINLTNLNFDPVANVLTADGTVTGTLAGLPFTTNITNFRLQLDDLTTPLVVECPVLDLALGPIDIDLLGLHVDTSAICLEITAVQGGGLLGDLLCGLTGTNLGNLGGILDLLIGQLNTALSQNQPGPGQGGGDICDGPCEILDLALGPLDLNLLGLDVELDNCANGPVQICVSASRGQGILGNLLCGLTNSQILNLTLAEIAQLANRALALAADGNLSRRDIAELTALLARLIR